MRFLNDEAIQQEEAIKEWHRRREEEQRKQDKLDEQTYQAVRNAKKKCACTIDNALQELYKETHILATDIELKHDFSYMTGKPYFFVNIKGQL